MKIKIIEITLPDAQYNLIGGTPIEKLMEAKSIEDIPDGKLDLIAALGEAEFARVRELMLAGAIIAFVRESGENADVVARAEQPTNTESE
jgi:hypothetical protein